MSPAPVHLGRADLARIQAADLAFTRFNNWRALRPVVGQLEELAPGGAIALRDATYKSSTYYTRIIGLDEDSLTHLDTLIAFQHEIGQPAAVSLTPHATRPVLAALAQRGFSLASTTALFTARPPAGEPGAGAIAIRRAQPVDFPALAAIWTQDLRPPPAPAIISRQAPRHFTPDFHFYLALVDGKIAAIASTFYHEGIAWLGNATTAHGYRGRGCQQALLQHRLTAAAAHGCDLAVVDTEFGTVSHRNVERAGFRLAYVALTLTDNFND